MCTRQSCAAVADACSNNNPGDGLAVICPEGSPEPTRLLSIPFALPSELALVHIHRHEPSTLISHADLVTIIEPSPMRSLAAGEVVTRLGAEGRGEAPSDKLIEVRRKYGERVQCQYFGVCSGCQVKQPPISCRSEFHKSNLATRIHPVSTARLRVTAHTQAERSCRSVQELLPASECGHSRHITYVTVAQRIWLPYQAHSSLSGPSV